MPNRVEKVAEITSWLRSHPVSSATRTSCELQVLDAAIVEKIEEAVEKAKVSRACRAHAPLSSCLRSHLCPPLQVKKSAKKVRVTVKPHLLFRVSASSWFLPRKGFLLAPADKKLCASAASRAAARRGSRPGRRVPPVRQGGQRSRELHRPSGPAGNHHRHQRR